MMPEKDPTTFGLLTYAWVIFLSSWGGAVNFLRKVRDGRSRPFHITEFIGEIMTSAFAGVITFWLCTAAGIDALVTAALVGIGGHMGSRAVYHFERWAETRLSIENED